MITPFQSIEQAIITILNSNYKTAGFVVAVNAEKVIAALDNEEIKNCLSSASLLYADGISVVKTIRSKGVENSRIPGCELWVELMKKVAESGESVYLLGASEETNKVTAEKLRDQFGMSNLTRRNGYFDDEQDIIDEVVRLKPDIVTVALGSPRQEFLIAKLREVHPAAFYMGVGGSYDVFVGKVKRAPNLFRKLHLEWLYRLIKQPSRVHRQVSLLRYFVLHLTGKL
ncbi:MAG TPA: WecB/TagA/CpsF family glycosyltransferase [Kangiella sp.]